MKQTAVKWLEGNLIDIGLDYPISKARELFQQAKEMEKQQIIDAHLNGQAEFDTQEFRKKIVDCAEQYYNETFKNK